MNDDENIHELMMKHLKALRNEVADLRRESIHELHSLSERVGALESHMTGLFKTLTNVGGDVEKFKFDMRQVKSRLNLTDTQGSQT